MTQGWSHSMKYVSIQPHLIQDKAWASQEISA